MKRRDFISVSGATVLTGLSGISTVQRPAFGIDFNISVPNKDPSNVGTVAVNFENLKITPKYINDNSDAKIQLEVELEGTVRNPDELTVSLTNNETKELSRRVRSVKYDQLNFNSPINGRVTVSVNHPSVNDKYNQRFTISSGDAVIVDSFEDGDISEYSGDKSSFSVVNGKSFRGENSLFTNSNNQDITSDSGLNSYPSRGDLVTWRLWHQNEDTGTAVRFGPSPAGSNHYFCGIRGNPQEIQLRSHKNGSILSNSFSTVSYPTQEWIEARFNWDTIGDGTLVLELYDSGGSFIDSVSINDTNYDSGKVHWSSSPQSSSEKRWMDYMTII